MYKSILKNSIILLGVIVLSLGSSATAQVSEVTQPPYIAELLETTPLTQDQVELMRNEDIDWGNIRIATLLAEKIAENEDNNLSFDEALDNILAARADGKDFGEIAAEYDLKLSNVLGNSPTAITASEEGYMEKVAAQEREKTQTKNQNKIQNKNIFQQLLGLLGLGKTQRPEETPRVEKLQKPERIEKPERVDRPERMERPERTERFEKMERHGRNS